jgi:FkbM family methyltransferase
MTSAGIRTRWYDALARLKVLRKGLPHGCDPQADIDRRLTATPIQLIFDVGANRGQSAVRLRRWYPAAELHCFEPVAETFAHLQRTVAGWPHVHTYRCALGATPGSGLVVRNETDDRSQIIPGEGTGETVDLDSVDRVCQRLGLREIDYLKVDTEGHDLAVLEGASSLLDSGAVAIVEVEAGMHPDNHFHVPATALSAFLEARGYRLFGVYEQTLEWPTADAHLRRANLVFVSPATVERNRWRTR